MAMIGYIMNLKILKSILGFQFFLLEYIYELGGIEHIHALCSHHRV